MVRMLEGAICITVPNFVAISQIVAEIWRFFDFWRRRPPPCWIFKFLKFKLLECWKCLNCITMPNVGRAVKPMQRYGDFSIFQDGGHRHLGFTNFHNFNCQNAQEVHTALSCQISWRSVKLSQRYANFSILPIWRLSAILELLCVCSDHPRRAFGGLYRCAKFDWIDAVVSIICMFFHFASLAWKCLFTPQILGFWGTATKPVHRLQIRPIVHN